MKHKFWQEAWKNKNIGFHLSSVNPSIFKHLQAFTLAENSNILVPLCGKSLDLIYLRDQGHNVTGVELSEIAIKDFFENNKINYEIEKSKDFILYTSPGLKIYQGDFLKIGTSLIGRIDFIYDRAAIVALPEVMRKDYFKHCIDLLSSKGQMLMITFERSPQTSDGPPHSVQRKELLDYSKHYFSHQILEESKEKIKSTRLKQLGIFEMKKIINKFVRI